MTAHQNAGTPPDARADRAPLHRGRRRPAVRWIAHGVLFVALVVGIFGLLPRLGGLTRDAAGLRHARPAFLAAAIVAQAVSLGCYAQLYRRFWPRSERGSGSGWPRTSPWPPSSSVTSPRSVRPPARW